VEKKQPAFFQLANVKKKPYKQQRLLYRTGGSLIVKIYCSIAGGNKRR
jgi:hypothetical protein